MDPSGRGIYQLIFEYLEHISARNPKDKILRIYNFSVDELLSFSIQIDRVLLKGAANLSEEFPREDFLNCTLRLQVGQTDRGVFGEPMNLVCEMSAAGFAEMKSRIESYGRNCGPHTHQWMFDFESEIDLLISLDGGW